MVDHILVEPVREAAAGLARWLLDRDPGVRTSGVGGFVVSAALFAEVPLEFLEGARIDGHLFRPALAGFEPDGDGYRAVEGSRQVPTGHAVEPAEVVPVDDGAQPEPVPVDFAPLDDAAPADDATEAWGCEDCGRQFGTQRGLSRHRAAVHSGESR